jgi:osmoprotectant transport system substrate-binding protein
VLLAGFLAVLAPGLLGGCTPADPAAEAEVPIRVGAGSTVEQQVLAALAAEALRRHDRPAEVVADLGDGPAVRDAALEGRVDAHWDYSGAAWTVSLGLTAPPVDAQESFEAVAAEDAAQGLRWLGPAPADARLALFVPADAVGSEEPTLSWFARTVGAGGGRVCADREYLTSPAGLPHLVDVYAISAEALEVEPADEAEALRRTAEGHCAAGLGSATSAEAAGRDLVALRDDQGVFPALAVAPVVRDGSRAADPVVVEVLEDLAALLTTERLAALNALADGGEPIDQLAVRVLDDAGLTGPTSR